MIHRALAQIFYIKWAIPGLFFFNSVFSIHRKQMFDINKFLLMIGFERQASGIRSNCFTN